jgi:hypothetical protein
MDKWDVASPQLQDIIRFFINLIMVITCSYKMLLV